MLKQIKNVFIVGIKGVAMANLAVILKKMGKKVSGSDTDEEFITDQLLNENNIPIVTSFSSGHLPAEIDTVIYSASHRGTENPQVKEALRRQTDSSYDGVQVVSQAEIIEEIMKEFKTRIAVCGTHGKTTTASLLAYTLSRLDQHPSYLVGTPSFNDMPGGDFSESTYFVLEADEYAINPPMDKTPKLDFYRPNYILATNVDFDHPDVYMSIDDVKDTFLNFFLERKIFACKDNENLMDVITNLPPENVKTFGFHEEADLQIKNIKATEEETKFDLISSDVDGDVSGKQIDMTFEISIFGEKNISNATGVIQLLLTLGFEANEIKKAMKGFAGAKRRFEKRVILNNTYLFDDYAHHPTEIIATIQAARQRFPNRRVIVLFQPHTFSRTQALLSEFSQALLLSDYSFVAPIFPSARENLKNYSISSFDITKNAKSMKAFATKKELIQELKTFLQKEDVIFTMGAGDIYMLENDIIEIIKKL